MAAPPTHAVPPTGAAAVERDATWQRTARLTVLLSFASLFWMTLEGAVGVYAGARASSVSLIRWALSSVVEGLASVVVSWHLTGDQALSPTSERTAQRAVAVPSGSWPQRSSRWTDGPLLAPAGVADQQLCHVQAIPGLAPGSVVAG